MSEYIDYGYHNSGPPHNFSYQLKILLGLLDKSKNKCIIDLGCGNGYLVNHLIEQGFNAYGTDASEKGIAIAREIHADRFFVQDLSSDQLPASLQGLSFDTVISTEVIEHLYDPERFMEFCRNVLKPGGEIIVTTPYHGYFKNIVLSIFNKWDQHMSPFWLGGHIKLWSRRTLTKLLTDHGFSIVSFTGCGRVPYLWMSMIIKSRLS